MSKIIELIEVLKNIQRSQIIDILIAVAIYLIFRILRNKLAYITIKIFKPKQNSKSIRKHGMYTPLRIFYNLLGGYVAILFLQIPFDINSNMINIINKIFKIGVIIIFTKGIANITTTKSYTINKMKEKINPEVEESMFKFILKVIRGIIYIIGGFLVITELGYNLNGLVAGVGISGLIITLAAQDTAKNLFAGAMLFLDKPFKVGDWIQVDTLEGTVEDLTFRSTRIRSFENAVINVPNLLISEKSIINWSRMEKRRSKINLCIELNTPLEKIEIIQKRIKEMLMKHDDVIDDTIIVRFDNITDNGMNLLVCSYTNSIDYASFLEEKEKVNFKIIQILKEEKVELAYDSKTVFVKEEVNQ